MNQLLAAINRSPADARTRQSFARRRKAIARASLVSIGVNEMSPLSPQPRPQVTVSRILEAVAEYHGLAMIDLISIAQTRGSTARGTKDVSYPRQIAMFLCCCEIDRSQSYIAGRFGRDPATVREGAGNIALLLMQGNERAAKDVAAIRAKLGLTEG